MMLVGCGGGWLMLAVCCVISREWSQQGDPGGCGGRQECCETGGRVSITGQLKQNYVITLLLWYFVIFTSHSIGWLAAAWLTGYLSVTCWMAD